MLLLERFNESVISLAFLPIDRNHVQRGLGWAWCPIEIQGKKWPQENSHLSRQVDLQDMLGAGESLLVCLGPIEFSYTLPHWANKAIG